jgi:hypothetical protein
MKYKAILGMIVIGMVSSGHGADGDRRGFITGIGLGFAPVCRFTVSEAGDMRENAPAVGYSALIGHGWGDRDITALEFNGAVRHSNYYSEIGRRTGYWDQPGVHGSQYIYQHFSGFSWYHYFGVPGKSLLTVAGLGLYNLGTKSLGGNDPGFGTLLGLGYEFARHYQATMYWTRGHSSDRPYDCRHSQLSVLVSWIRY